MSKFADASVVKETLRRVRAWQREPLAAIACPVCGSDGLHVVDRSARPQSEWFAITCAACGLDDAIHIPMSPPAWT